MSGQETKTEDEEEIQLDQSKEVDDLLPTSVSIINSLVLHISYFYS